MNIHTDDSDRDDAGRDARFDAAMRARHADALAHVPVHLRWQLRPGAARMRTQAAPATRANWRGRVALAGALAGLCALAVGLGLRDAPAPAAPASAIASLAPQDSPVATLDQDPDFYAWLASEDADLVAME